MKTNSEMLVHSQFDKRNMI